MGNYDLRLEFVTMTQNIKSTSGLGDFHYFDLADPSCVCFFIKPKSFSNHI